MISTLNSTTTSVLLEALFDTGNEDVWRAFNDRYRPIIFAFACRLGVTDEDAADVAQQTLTEFVRDYRAGKYDRARGRLSSWIISIAHHRALDVLRSRQRRGEQRGESALLNIADSNGLTEIWDGEHRRALFEHGLRLLWEQTATTPRTLRVFEMLVFEDVAAPVVAEQCQIDVAEVYRIKNRLTKRLREIVAELESAYEEAG